MSRICCDIVAFSCIFNWVDSACFDTFLGLRWLEFFFKSRPKRTLVGHVRCKRMECRRQAPSSLNAPYWCEAGTLQGPIVNMHGFSRLSMHIPVVSSLSHFSISESVLKFLWCLRYDNLIELICIFVRCKIRWFVRYGIHLH